MDAQLERISRTIYDDHGVRLQRIERQVRHITLRAPHWERAAQLVLDGETSLERISSRMATAIASIEGELGRLAAAREHERRQADLRAVLLGANVAMTVFTLLGLLALLLMSL